MANIFDYVNNFADKSFSDVCIGEADNIVFCRLAYLDLSKHTGKTLGEISESFTPSGSDKKVTADTEKLLKEIGKTKRFEYITLYNTREIISEDRATAFYAASFAIDKETFFISFRGTDDKILSFYEDAKLAYTFPIGSQTSTFGYVSSQMENHSGKFYLGGHSKGGNLAVFSFLFLSENEKKELSKYSIMTDWDFRKKFQVLCLLRI